MKQKNKLPTVWMVITGMVIFFPVGFLLLYIRLLRYHRTKVMLGIGNVCLGIFSLGIVISIMTLNTPIIDHLSFIFGLAMLVFPPFLITGNIMKRFDARAAAKKSQLSDITGTYASASQNPTPSGSTFAYQSSQDISRSSNFSSAVTTNPGASKRQKAILCPYCGGDNMVADGTVTQCRFCDSYISYNM